MNGLEKKMLFRLTESILLWLYHISCGIALTGTKKHREKDKAILGLLEQWADE